VRSSRVTRFGPHTGEANHRAHSQAWATSPRRRNRGNPSRLEDRQTRRERQPQGSRREETRGPGSMPFKHDITGTGGRGSIRATAGRTTKNNPPPGRQTNLIGTVKRPPTKAKMQSTLDPIRARHHRNGRARFHPSHRWTHNKQQPTTGPPNALHRQQKTPGPGGRTTWCGTLQAADATAHASSTSARPRAGWPVIPCRLKSDQSHCRRLGWDESQAPRSGIDERTHTQSQRHPPAEAKRPFGVCAKDSVAKLFVFPAGFLLLH